MEVVVHSMMQAMPRLITSYIFKEMVGPFLICLVVLTGTALLSKSTKLIEMGITYRVGLWSLAVFIASLIPNFLIYIIPMSFLVAVLFAFNRLSSESELTAMKASGLSLYRLSMPVLALAVLVYIVSLAVTVYLFPLGNNQLKKILSTVARTKSVAGIQENTFNTTFEGLTFYAGRIPKGGNTILDVFISDRREDGEPTIIFAKSGTFVSDTEGASLTLKLESGTVHSSDEVSGEYRLISFNTYDFVLPIRDELAEHTTASKSNRELYLDELVSRIKEKGERGLNQAPYVIDLHKRFALPASVFVFALLGVPLGIQRIRTARFTSFSVALGVVLTYYVLSTAMESLGENGMIGPILSVWGSDLVMGIVGSYVFLKASKDASLLPFQRADGGALLRRVSRRKA
ncbi:MAG: LPS export ABC transporter permease LptF [Thermodesulfobacteriota bacterium]